MVPATGGTIVKRVREGGILIVIVAEGEPGREGSLHGVVQGFSQLAALLIGSHLLVELGLGGELVLAS